MTLLIVELDKRIGNAQAWRDTFREQRPDLAIRIWPICPQCGSRRITACPICHTSGTSFPPADSNYDAVAGPQGSLAVICTICDEPWLPKFLRRCEWCGHDFGEGISFELRERQTSEENFNYRVTILLFSLVLLVSVLLAWFSYIGR